MIEERARLLSEKAKPIPKYKPNSAPSQPQPSTSRPDVSSSPLLFACKYGVLLHVKAF